MMVINLHFLFLYILLNLLCLIIGSAFAASRVLTVNSGHALQLAISLALAATAVAPSTQCLIISAGERERELHLALLLPKGRHEQIPGKRIGMVSQ